MKAPRLAFVGLGWIGRARLEALAATAAGEVAALCDRDAERLAETAAEHRRAAPFEEPEQLLAAAARLGLDGVVVATPTASHVELTEAALQRGLAVLCQKPLAADAAGCRRAVAAARRADRLLGVDYSYRALPGMAPALRRVRGGGLGQVVHVHGAFHNAYGPDKAWCWDAAAAGGGAFLDLGVYLLGLTLELMYPAAVTSVAARCRRAGRSLAPPVAEVEDFADARFDFSDGAVAELAASWCAHAGADCIFRLEVFGTRGGFELVNLGGSFFDFELAWREGRRRTLVSRPGAGDLAGAAVTWARRLARNRRFDPAAASLVAVAEAVDRVYGREAERSSTAPRSAASRRLPAPSSSAFISA